MVEKGADIDLLFRNGLKDLEVLPPVGVWGTIYPAIRRKQKPYILLRSAALIAVLVSISVLAYRWSRNISSQLENPVLALEQESIRYQNIDNVAVVRPASPYNKIAVTEKRNTTVVSHVPESVVNTPGIDSKLPVFNINVSGTGSKNVPDLMKPVKNPDLRNLFTTTDDSYSGTYSLYGDYTYDAPKNNTGKWSLIAAATPSYNMRTDLGNDKVSEQMSSSEQSRISYSGGMGVGYRISRRLSVQSGLYYTSIGQEIENIYSFSGFQRYDQTKSDHNFEVLTSGGVIYTDNADVFLLDNSGGRVLTMYTNDVFDPAKANLSYVNNSLRQTFSYLEMPLILRYKLIDKNIDFNLIGGLSYNLLVNNTVHTYVDGNKYSVGKTEGLNPFMVSSSLGMGMEYNLSGKISLNLEPMFRYYLNPFSETAGIRTHPYSFGIFSGLSYKF
jgi:hypothetical protein